MDEATKPVGRLAGAVAGRNPDDLSPVGTDDLPLELRPLADAFDGYLTRIGALRQSERDFAANAAHELRTPLAALRGRLELSTDPDAMAAVSTIDALDIALPEARFARGKQSTGLGLGLSIVDSLANAMEVQLTRNQSPPIVRFGMTFKVVKAGVYGAGRRPQSPLPCPAHEQRVVLIGT